MRQYRRYHRTQRTMAWSWSSPNRAGRVLHGFHRTNPRRPFATEPWIQGDVILPEHSHPKRSECQPASRLITTGRPKLLSRLVAAEIQTKGASLGLDRGRGAVAAVLAQPYTVTCYRGLTRRVVHETHQLLFPALLILTWALRADVPTSLTALGDSIGEGVQSADATTHTQPYEFSNLIAQQMGVSFPLPLIQGGALTIIFSTRGRTRIDPSLMSPNLAVSGATIHDLLVSRYQPPTDTRNRCRAASHIPAAKSRWRNRGTRR